VWIEGGADDVAFMERLAVAVSVEGGHPIISIYTDEMIRGWYREVPEHFDTQRDEWLWYLYEKADVLVFIHRSGARRCSASTVLNSSRPMHGA
jgi:hypothetical protein